MKHVNLYQSSSLSEAPNSNVFMDFIISKTAYHEGNFCRYTMVFTQIPLYLSKSHALFISAKSKLAKRLHLTLWLTGVLSKEEMQHFCARHRISKRRPRREMRRFENVASSLLHCHNMLEMRCYVGDAEVIGSPLD